MKLVRIEMVGAGVSTSQLCSLMNVVESLCAKDIIVLFYVICLWDVAQIYIYIYLQIK